MPNYIIGLDLGQTHDYTALAIVTSSPGEDFLSLPHVQRFPLNVPYSDMIGAITRIVSKPPLIQALLVVDQTGVGRPVVDLLRQSVKVQRVIPITITSVNPTSDQNQPVFKLPSNTCGFVQGSGGTVAAGTSCTLTVSFTPNSATTFTGKMTIGDDDITGPQTVTLKGTGTTN